MLPVERPAGRIPSAADRDDPPPAVVRDEYWGHPIRDGAVGRGCRTTEAHEQGATSDGKPKENQRQHPLRMSHRTSCRSPVRLADAPCAAMRYSLPAAGFTMSASMKC